jgi:glycosyltransferase involved in cell wall biosynthesis
MSEGDIHMTQQKCFVMAGFFGGLEFDIEDRHSQIEFVLPRNIPELKYPLVRTGTLVYELFKAKLPENAILSCGGLTEFVAAVIYSIARRSVIYTPGVSEKYFRNKFLAPIFFIVRKGWHKGAIFTCSIEFKNAFNGIGFYSNFPTHLKNAQKLELPKQRNYDIALVGPVDENKRFVEFVKNLNDECERYNTTVSILHIGRGQLGSLPRVNVKQLGYIDIQNEVMRGIASCRLLCISSSYEGSPRVFWEATCSETPVIASSCGNMRFMASVPIADNLVQLSEIAIRLRSMGDGERRHMAKMQLHELLNWK